VDSLAGFWASITADSHHLISYLEGKEISLFGNGLAMVYRHTCACHWYSAGNNNLAINDLKTAATLGNESAKNYLRSQGISL